MNETTSTATLVEFLRARLDHDKWVTYNPALMPVAGPGLSDLVKRAWAEVEAKRRILKAHAEHPDPYIAGFCRTCGRTDGPCDTLRLLALPYADHPDYREEWRPA